MAKKAEKFKRGDNEIMKWLIDENIPFDCKITKNFLSIKTATKTYKISEKFLDLKTLALINKTKKYADSINLVIPKKLEKDKINYFNFFIPKKEVLMRDVVEIDISGAYWQIAYHYNVINEEIYKKGLLPPAENESISDVKKRRLIALGSLASIGHNYRYDGINEPYSLPPTLNAKTRNYWFFISQKLGELMARCIDNVGQDAFIFFWVDAFFVKKEYQQKVFDFLKSEGYNAKSIDLDYVKVEFDTSRNSWIMNCKIKNGKIKPFYFSDDESNNKKIKDNLKSFFRMVDKMDKIKN